jgi:hypothetical protein
MLLLDKVGRSKKWDFVEEAEEYLLFYEDLIKIVIPTSYRLFE